MEKSAPSAAPRPNQSWVCPGIHFQPWAPGESLARFPHGTCRVVPQDLADVADQCRTSRSWAEHSRHYALVRNIVMEDWGPEWLTPEMLVREKLLTPTDQVWMPGEQSFPPPVRIQTAYFLTVNRHQALARGVSSLRDHCEKLGRQLDIVVCDDSGNEELETVNAGALKGLGFRHLTRSGREAFVHDLFERSGINPSLLRWACGLEGAQGISSSAIQNCRNLLAAGTAFLSSDDDLVFTAYEQNPDPATLVLSSANDPQEIHFDTDCPPVFVDILGSHEKWLGRGPMDLVGPGLPFTGVRFQGWEPEIAARHLRSDAAIRVSYAGYWGDPGDNPSKLLLELDPALLHRIPDRVEDFRKAMREPFYHRICPHPTLSLPGRNPEGASAVDNRVMLPPQMPQIRGNDAFWAACLHVLRPEACIGHVPLALAHLPAHHRIFPVLDEDPAVTKAYLIHPVSWMIKLLHSHLNPCPLNDPVARMEHLGRECEILAGNARSFEEAVRHFYVEIAVETIATLSSRIESSPSEILNNFLELMIPHYKDAARSPEPYLTASTGGWDRARHLWQSWGALCRIWPVVWQAALETDEAEKLERFTVPHVP